MVMTLSVLLFFYCIVKVHVRQPVLVPLRQFIERNTMNTQFCTFQANALVLEWVNRQGSLDSKGFVKLKEKIIQYNMKLLDIGVNGLDLICDTNSIISVLAI